MEFITLPLFTKYILVATAFLMVFMSIMTVALGEQDDEKMLTVLGVLFGVHTLVYICVLSGMTISFGVEIIK